MKAYYVISRSKSSNVSMESGPFRSRAEAERMAVETAKRNDVQPNIGIRTVEVPDQDEE